MKKLTAHQAAELYDRSQVEIDDTLEVIYHLIEQTAKSSSRRLTFTNFPEEISPIVETDKLSEYSMTAAFAAIVNELKSLDYQVQVALEPIHYQKCRRVLKLEW